jgi:hypothetical protein
MGRAAQLRVTARMTRNTSLSMGPVGWLIVGPLILAALFPVLAVALAACMAGLAVGLPAYWVVKGIIMWRQTRP